MNLARDKKFTKGTRVIIVEHDTPGGKGGPYTSFVGKRGTITGQSVSDGEEDKGYFRIDYDDGTVVGYPMWAGYIEELKDEV